MMMQQCEDLLSTILGLSMYSPSSLSKVTQASGVEGTFCASAMSPSASRIVLEGSLGRAETWYADP